MVFSKYILNIFENFENIEVQKLLQTPHPQKTSPPNFKTPVYIFSQHTHNFWTF
jgi:hypothetical protein